MHSVSPNSVLLRSICVISFFTPLFKFVSSFSIIIILLGFTSLFPSWELSWLNPDPLRLLVPLCGIDFPLKSTPPSFPEVFPCISLTPNPVLLLGVPCTKCTSERKDHAERSAFFLLWPRRCHCTRQPLIHGCSPHSSVLLHACGLVKCHMQFFAVLSYNVDPSFLLSYPLSGSMYIAVVCYFGVSLIFHPVQMSKVSQPLIPYSILLHGQPSPTLHYTDSLSQ